MKLLITRFLDHFSEVMTPVIEKVSGNHYIKALQQGVMKTGKITRFGSIFIILYMIPIASWQTFIKTQNIYTSVPILLTFGILPIYISYLTAKELSYHYKLKGKVIGALSALVFVVAQFNHYFEYRLDWLGGKGFTTALMIGLVIPSLIHKVRRSVENKNYQLFLIIVILLALSGVFIITDNHIMDGLNTLIKPLVWFVSKPYGILFMVVLSQLFWSVGIHGSSLMNLIGTPVYTFMLAENVMSLASTGTSPYIPALGFLPAFVDLGGSGSTLALVLVMRLFGDHDDKKLAQDAMKPALKNVNEPVIFGVPIVGNTLMIIPFVLADVFLVLFGYFIIARGYVGAPIAHVNWTLAPILSSFFITGLDYRAPLLVVVALLVVCLIYLPFYLKYKSMKDVEER